jgi:hypothetical protein
MTAEESFTPDRTGWPAGPWDNEGDREDWVDEATGTACFIQRNHLGSWCGYASVKPGHPDYGKGYEDVEVEVHGGLTYAAACRGHLCHVPQPGEPDNVWWFGFDCGHAFDQQPAMEAYNAKLGLPPLSVRSTYREAAYAKAETTKLAAQLWERR